MGLGPLPCPRAAPGLGEEDWALCVPVGGGEARLPQGQVLQDTTESWGVAGMEEVGEHPRGRSALPGRGVARCLGLQSQRLPASSRGQPRPGPSSVQANLTPTPAL